jgi:hypothetical protein
MAGISLRNAFDSNQLETFIAQVEAAGFGNADRLPFEAMVGRVTAPQPEGQISRSPAPGSKHGK